MMKSDRTQEHRLALLALGLDEPAAPAGNCLGDETMAALIDNSLDQEERADALIHISRCERCYEAWLALCDSVPRNTDSAALQLSFWRRNLRAIGSAVAIAASVAIFFALPYTHHETQTVTSMLKNMPQHKGENDAVLHAPVMEIAEPEMGYLNNEKPAAEIDRKEQINRVERAPAPLIPHRSAKKKTLIYDSDYSTGREREVALPTSPQDTLAPQQREQSAMPATGSTLGLIRLDLPGFIDQLQHYCENTEEIHLPELQTMLRRTQATNAHEAQIISRLQQLFASGPNDPKNRFCARALAITLQNRDDTGGNNTDSTK